MKRLTTFVIFVLVGSVGLAQDSQPPAPSGSSYFVGASAGWGPDTGARGEGSVGVRIRNRFYSVTCLNLAGGVGAVVQDFMYRAATSRGVTLWARGGAGATMSSSTDLTSYAPTFGGGVMLSYDLGKVRESLSGLELTATAKAMHTTVIRQVDGVSQTQDYIRPQYFIGLKFNWQ